MREFKNIYILYTYIIYQTFQHQRTTLATMHVSTLCDCFTILAGVWMHVVVQNNYYDCSLIVNSWASLASSTDGAPSTSMIVDHVYGLVARFLQTLNTEAKQWIGSLLEAVKHSWSLWVSPIWMLMTFHFEDTRLATSFIKSDSSGSLPNPTYFPKPTHEEDILKLTDTP